MHVVTLTSDWSKEDFYISSLTGAILSLSNDIQFVQVNNSIKQFNVIEGCFILKHSFFHFPKGTIHLFGVNSEPLDGQNIIIMNYKEHWFVSIDDGRLSLIVDSDTNINAIYKLPDKLKIGTFSALGYFKEAVKLIINNSVDKLEKLNGIKYAANNIPTINGLNLQGNIIHIDSYGNAISNISKKFFIEYYLKLSGELNRNPDFTIYIGGPRLSLDGIAINYDDVENGETIALFNSLDLLEFAINNGNLSTIENIDVTTEILVKFK